MIIGASTSQGVSGTAWATRPAAARVGDVLFIMAHNDDSNAAYLPILSDAGWTQIRGSPARSNYDAANVRMAWRRYRASDPAIYGVANVSSPLQYVNMVALRYVDIDKMRVAFRSRAGGSVQPHPLPGSSLSITLECDVLWFCVADTNTNNSAIAIRVPAGFRSLTATSSGWQHSRVGYRQMCPPNVPMPVGTHIQSGSSAQSLVWTIAIPRTSARPMRVIGPLARYSSGSLSVTARKTV